MEEQTPSQNNSENPSASSDFSTRSILIGTGWLIVSQILGAVLYFIAYRFILSTFTKDEHGDFFWIQQIGTLIMICLVEIGMTTVATGLVARDGYPVEKVTNTLLTIRLILWVMATIVLGGIAVWRDISILPLFIVWSLHALIAAKVQIIRSVLEIQRRAASDQFPSSLAGLLDAIIFLGLIWLNKDYLSALSVMVFLVVSSVPGFVVMLLLDKQYRALRFHIDKKILEQLFQLSLPVLTIVILQQIHDKADTFFLDYFTNPTELGVYGAVYRLTQPVFMFVVAFAGALFPVVARMYRYEPAIAQVYVVSATSLIILAGVVFATIITFCAPVILFLGAGVTYQENVAELRFMSWALSLGFAQVFLLTILTAFNEQRALYKIFVTMVIITLVGNSMVVPLWKIQGVMLVKAMSLFISSVLSVGILGRLYGATVFFRLVRTMVVVFGIGGASTFFLERYTSPVVGFCLVIPIFALIVRYAGVISKAEFQVLRERLQ